MIAQMRNYRAPGSTTVMMVYHRYAWKVLVILLTCGKGKFWRLSELVAEHSEAQTGCPVTYICSRKQARKLLESAGFRVIEAAVDHIFRYRVPSCIQYRYDKAWFFRWLPGAVFRWA